MRRMLQRSPAGPAAGAPPSEAEALQQLSQEGLVRRLSSFVAARAIDVGQLVEYVPSSGASGVRWGSNETLVTTLAGQPVVALTARSADTTRIPIISRADSVRGELVLTVARDADGGTIWLVGAVGGFQQRQCEQQEVKTYVLGSPMPDGFAGAGMFDLDGRIVGMIVRCDGGLVALPANEVTRIAKAIDADNERLRTTYGLAVQPLDARSRAHFRADSGILVVEVHANSAAARAGLVPGDIIVQVADVAVDNSVPRALLGADTATSFTVAITVRRENARRTLQLTRSIPSATPSRFDAGLGFGASPAAAGVAITEVRTGSAAARAGLRVGDRLLRIGGNSVNGREQAARAVERGLTADSINFAVFQRDSIMRGVWVRR
ncbi:MAG: PDZ domain-containing protein [Gemmatimonadaceae bacterium]